MNKITEIIMRDVGNPEVTEQEVREIGRVAINVALGLEEDA